MTRLAMIVLVAAACRKAPAPAGEEKAAERDAAPVAVAAPVDAAPAVDCDAALSPIGAEVQGVFVAAAHHVHARKVRELWPAVPEACRTGEWYLVAAQMLALETAPFEAAGVRLASRDEALAAAVAQPADPDVLAYVAFTAGVGGATALPADACAAASAPGESDAARYVCGHAALAAGDAKTAAERFAAIESPARFADLDLRRAEAERALGRTKEARALAKAAAALTEQRAAVARASGADRDAIVAAAKALLAR